VATGAGHIKAGAGCCSERIAKYNLLLWIKDELVAQAQFAGIKAFKIRWAALQKYLIE